MYKSEMNYLQMLAKPLASMWEGIFLLIPAGLTAALLGAINSMVEVVRVEPILAKGLAALMFIDFLSGSWKALQKKQMVTSIGIRQTSIKLIEYILACLGFIVLSNMAEAPWIAKTAFVWLGFIEMKSIVENLTDKKGVINELYEHIRETFKKRADDSND